MVGETVSHYRILEKLGEGGMGEVYKALDLRLKRHVALKVLLPAYGQDPQRRARFEREAWAASGLDHPNVGTVYEIDETGDGRLFLAMAYYEGETLQARLKAAERGEGPLGMDEALGIAHQLAEGLGTAHEKDVVHRDVKPANILLTTGGQVKLIDFGIAKLKGAGELTGVGLIVGSLPYMSPEQTWGKEVDGRTDIWSFGVVLYEMLAGQRPFDYPHDPGLQHQIRREPPSSLHKVRPDLPAWIEGVVERCLEKEPEARFASAADLIAALDSGETIALEAGEPVVEPGAAEPNRRWRPAVIFALLGGLLLLLPLLLWALRSGPSVAEEGTSDAEAYALYREGREELKEYMDPVRVDAAVDALARAVERDSAYAAAQAGLGEAYLRKYQHTGDSVWVGLAHAHTGRALRLDPRSVDAHVTLGLMALIDGRAREAIAEFRRAQSLDSTSAAAWRGFGDAYKALGDTRAAEHAFHRAVELDSTYWIGYNKLGDLYFSSGDYEGAIRQFRRVLALDPDNVDGLNNLGAMLMALERYREAEEVFLRLLEIHPTGWAHANLGTIYFYDAGDYERAADHYERALQYEPGDYSIYGNLGNAYSQMPGHEREAEEAYSRAAEVLQKGPGWAKNPLHTSALATYLVELGDHERALSLVDAAVSPEPQNVEVMANAAYVYANTGDTLNAMRWLCRAVKGGYSRRIIDQTSGLSELIRDTTAFRGC